MGQPCVIDCAAHWELQRLLEDVGSLSLTLSPDLLMLRAGTFFFFLLLLLPARTWEHVQPSVNTRSSLFFCACIGSDQGLPLASQSLHHPVSVFHLDAHQPGERASSVSFSPLTHSCSKCFFFTQRRLSVCIQIKYKYLSNCEGEGAGLVLIGSNLFKHSLANQFSNKFSS